MSQKRKNLSQSTITEENAIKRSRRIQDQSFAGPSTSQGRSQGRAGRVLKICMRNFMCHSSLQVKLDPNTNYIIGRNGSGKSAILTALIVGLGGKARLTNRGANMKAFIKVGEASALVEITLTNTGPAAYNPSELGHEITIIRSFTAAGGNSYKLKSSSGQVITTSLREIVRVIEALNIHVDNPICILNQDVARTFLNTNDPTKKYEMFMKATCLDSVKDEYKIAVKNKNTTAGLLQGKLEALRILEVEVKKWLKKYKAFEAMSDIERKKNCLEIESVWAQINEIEAELREKEEKLEEITNDLKSFTDLVQNKAGRKNEINEKIEQIRQQLLEIRNMETANRDLMEEKRRILHKLRESFVGRKNEITAIENMINRKNGDKKNIEDEISNSSTNQNNRLKVIEERDAKMVSLEKTVLDIKKLFETADNDLMQTRNALEHKRTEENNIKRELEDLNERIRHRQTKIRNMKSDENNAVSVYGGNMQRILHAINAAKEQFSKQPRGPVGSYIKLKDRKWALAIEDFVSQGMLMSFCVDNQKDAKILSRIFNEVGGGPKPTIICSKFHDKIHNYSRNKVEAPHGCIAMIDAMIIKDPVITNCLIDQLSIEMVLLISSNDLARQLMSDAGKVPKSCSRAVTLCGDQFYPDPNYRSYSCRNKQPRFLQVSVADVIRNYEEEIKNFMQNHEVVERQTRSVSQDAQRLSREVQSLQNKLIKLETAQGKIQRDINDLKFQVLPSEPNIEILAEEMKEISKIIESKQNDLRKISEDADTIKQQIKDVEGEYSNLKQISKGLETRMTPLLEEVADCETKLKQIDINTRRHTEKIEQCRKKVADTKQECDKKKKFLNEKLQSAVPLGPRMETDRSLETVLAELHDTEQQLAECRTSMGDKMMVTQEYMRYQDKYDKTKVKVDQIQACVDQINKTLESRARSYQKLAEYIGVRVREMFTGVLKMRQFKGTVEIDHDKHTLQLVVIPQHGASQGTGQTHILSGGERSFSTVAFLHALWQVTEHPFYFLDEFDVFMDKVNRRTVMDILLEHAKEHTELQYVFLTPQDISSVIGDKDITVHRMADPQRNTTPK